MVDIALDPNMYYRTMPTPQTLYKAAELGFEHVELSPNADLHFWHHRPAADDAFVAELNKAQKESGVKVRTLNPVFNWSSLDERERVAQVSNWRRLLELADAIDVREITSEFSGGTTPRAARSSGSARSRSSSRTSRSTGSASTWSRIPTTSSSCTTTPCASCAPSTRNGSATSSAARTSSTSPTGRGTPSA